MASPSTPTDSPLETDLWRWLLFESGLSRRRARALILQGAQSNALSLFWQAGPEILAQQLTLTPDETALVRAAQTDWPRWQQQFETERRQGLHSLRINQTGYPPTLTRFLTAETRPLLLFMRGEISLLSMPMVLPVAQTPTPTLSDWGIETLLGLALENALPLFIAQPGFHAQAVKTFLDAGIPFALVMPQGLMQYTPPASLQQALDEERLLLISPFRPMSSKDEALLPHARIFARALAHALLALSAPDFDPAPGQPCFHGPDMPDSPHCQEAYRDAESFFLRLEESAQPVAASIMTVTSAPIPELPPLNPDEILGTLAQGGHIPAALADRLRQLSPSSSSDTTS